MTNGSAPRDDLSDRVNAALAGGGRLFVLALTIALVLTGAVLVEKERVDAYLARQQATDRVIGKLGPVVREAQLNEEYLDTYMITAYGGFGDREKALRQLLKDRRDATRLMTGLLSVIWRTKSVDLEARDAVRKRAERYQRLLAFNQDMMVRETSEPTLMLAEVMSGSFRITGSTDDMSMEDLARLSYAASLRPDLLSGVSISIGELETGLRAETFADIAGRLAEAEAESRRAPSMAARSRAEILYGYRGKMRKDPGAFGLTGDGKAPVRIGHLRRSYAEALAFRAPPDTQAWRDEAQIDPFRIGLKLSLASAAVIAPAVVSGLLLLAALSLWRAARLTRANAAPNKAVIALPQLVEPEARLGDAPGGHSVQLIVLLLPAGLVTYCALALRAGQPLVLFAELATLALVLAVRDYRRAARMVQT